MEQSGGGGGAIISIIYLAILVLIIVSFWKVFTKAGKPGWAAIVPIYNLVVMLEIVKRPIWWIVLFLIPIVSIYPAVMIAMDMAESFGKSKLWGIGLLLFLPFIGYPILAFTDATYTEPSR